MLKRALVLAVLVLGSFAGGCKKDNPMKPATVSSVTVGAPTAAIYPGGTTQLTATAIFSDSTTQNVTSTATWESSDNNIATVLNGLLSAKAAGSVTVGATFQSVKGSVPVNVSPVAIKANIEGPTVAQHDTKVTFSGLGSTSTPYPIAKYTWNCGQNVNGFPNCTNDSGIPIDINSPTPSFYYRRCGVTNRPACRAGSTNQAVYTVTLTVTDSQGNTNTATATITITNDY